MAFRSLSPFAYPRAASPAFGCARPASPVYARAVSPAFRGRAVSPVYARAVSPVAYPRAASPVFRGRAVSPVAYPRPASPVYARAFSPVAYPRAASPVFRGRAVSPVAYPRPASPVYARAVSPVPYARAVSPVPYAGAVSPVAYAPAVPSYNFARAGTPVYGGSACGPVVTPDVTVRHAPTVSTHLEPRVVRYDEPVTTVTEHFSTSRRIYNGYGGQRFFGYDGVNAGLPALSYGFDGFGSGCGGYYY